LAIASNLAKDVMRQLLEQGVVRRGYLGIGIRELEPEVATRLGVGGEGGVYVSQVYDKAPAAKGGMQTGDVIVSIAGRPVHNGTELQRLVASLPLGKPAEVAVVRDGQTRTLAVTITEQPEEFPTAAGPRRGTGSRRGGEVEELSLENVGLD